MPTINQASANLVGGVSQQPDILKLPGQVREAENVLLDPTFGCRKRPPVQFIKQIAPSSDAVPANAKWFPIFRDNRERYVVAVYEDTGVPVLRVWEADTGTERNVDVFDDAYDYLKTVDYANNIQELTINDYTLLSNRDVRPTMDINSIGRTNDEALVVVEEVSYSTVYAIDFLRDGAAGSQTKVYKAEKISVSPASWEVADSGLCTLAGTSPFTVNQVGKTNLQFNLTVNCDPFMTHGETPGTWYPTGVECTSVDADGIGEYFFDGAQNYAEGSYLYKDFTVTTAAGNIQVRAEFRVRKDPGETGKYFYQYITSGILSYTTTTVDWKVDQKFENEWTNNRDFTTDRGKFYPNGYVFKMKYNVKTVLQGPGTPTYTYKSRYTANVQLTNGGAGWRKGDTAIVTYKGQDYLVRVEEESFQYTYEAESTVSYTTASSGNLDVGTIVSNLVSGINTLTPYFAKGIGNVIYIKRDTDTREFNIATRGGAGNGAMRAVKGSVSDVSKLPAQAEPGFTITVRNSGSTMLDDYYLKFVGAEGEMPGAGSWEETVAPGSITDFNPYTMPYALIRESDGDFTLRALSRRYSDKLYWKERLVGSEETNREPTFVGKAINSMFFFRNRLGILSDSSVVLSQPGDYFNFWRKSAMVVSDADPIDMAPSATKPATFKWALGTPAGLMLFADSSQYMMASRDIAFGPATAEMTEISNFAFNTKAPPIETGVSLIFVTEDTAYTQVFEYLADNPNSRPLSAELSKLVPEYIPTGIRMITSSPNSGVTLLGDGSNYLWVFRYYNQANQRLMAGWSKWKLPCPVLMVGYNQDTAYVVCNNDGNIILGKIETTDNPGKSSISAFGRLFTPRLDLFVRGDSITPVDNLDGTYDLPFPDGAYVEGSTACVLYTQGSDSTSFLSPEVQESGGSYYVVVDEETVSNPYVLGLEYSLSVEMPTFFLKGEGAADTVNNIMVQFVNVDLFMAGLYSARVVKQGYDDVVLEMDVPQIGVSYANEPSVRESANVSIPIFSPGNTSKLILESSNPTPSSIISYSWTGRYSTRGVKAMR
jgi:hypothetical protein